MADFKLTQLASVDAAIAAAHQTWLTQHAPAFVRDYLSHLQSNGVEPYYGFAENPAAWSGARLFETKIAPGSRAEQAVFARIKSLPYRTKLEKKALKAFLVQYAEEETRLKQQFLANAVQQTFNELYRNASAAVEADEFTELADGFKNFFLDFALQQELTTKEACLKLHGLVTKLYFEPLQKTPWLITHPAAQQQLEQLEVLTKRWLDGCYKTARLQTRKESVLSKLSTTSSALGALTGVTAAVLGVLSFFIPPLALPAMILGFISLVSYVSTALSAFQILENGINHKRSPSSREIAALAFDILTLPLNFIGGTLLHALKHVVHSITTVARIHKEVADATRLSNKVWNRVGSNLTDLPYLHETATDTVAMLKQLGANKTKLTAVATLTVAEHQHQTVASTAYAELEQPAGDTDQALPKSAGTAAGCVETTAIDIEPEQPAGNSASKVQTLVTPVNTASAYSAPSARAR